MKRRAILACAVTGLLVSILTAGCGSAGPNVTVAITSPTSPQVIEAGQTVKITASVTSAGGTASANVNWSLVGCAGSSCGTLSTETGSSVTYTAPASVPNNTTVVVVVTSVTEPSQAASVSITVLAISVQMQKKVTEVAAVSEAYNTFGASFTATVQDDPANQGVTWTLTANGAACSPACGTLSGSNPYSVQYLPPASVPAAPNNTPTITAVSISDPTKTDSDTFTIFDGATACSPGGNESLLKGEYAIMLQGWIGNGSTPLLFAASFGADGTGKITGGADQFDPFLNMSYAGSSIFPSASSYSVGPDNRGCLVLTDQFDTTFTFQFSLGGVSGGTASKGDIILFNQQSATPQRAAGILRLQDPSAFSLTALAPNYGFGLDGWENSTGVLTHFATVGMLAQSGGNLPLANFDANDGGKLVNAGVQGFFGTIAGPVSTMTGMATATLQINAPFYTAHGEIYIINSSELFFVGYDLGEEASGRLIASPSSYSASSLAPTYILHMTGSLATAASASIGQVTFTPGTSSPAGTTGTVSGTFSDYTLGAPSKQSLSGTYGFGNASGRVGIGGANNATSPVCYLTNPFDDVSGFCISTDSTASLGVLATQPPATYGNSSLSGNFFFGSGEPGDNTVPDISGIASISSGSLTGTEDVSGQGGLTLDTAISAAFSINADGTGTLGPHGVIVTNGTELYFINEASGAPAAVQVFEP